MQGEIRGAPGVGDCKLALVGGVSSRQVKPERGGKETGLLLPKNFISEPRSGCPVAIINMLGIQRRKMMPPM